MTTTFIRHDRSYISHSERRFSGPTILIADSQNGSQCTESLACNKREIQPLWLPESLLNAATASWFCCATSASLVNDPTVLQYFLKSSISESGVHASPKS
jgi:hypothetical protein